MQKCLAIGMRLELVQRNAALRAASNANRNNHYNNSDNNINNNTAASAAKVSKAEDQDQEVIIVPQIKSTTTQVPISKFTKPKPSGKNRLTFKGRHDIRFPNVICYCLHVLYANWHSFEFNRVKRRNNVCIYKHCRTYRGK